MITGMRRLISGKAMAVGAFSYLTKPFEDMESSGPRASGVGSKQPRIETALLRDRLEHIPARNGTQQPETIKTTVFDQMRHTLSFLESFRDKRDQPRPRDMGADG